MKVLLISTVREFYRQRAGVFFVMMGVLLGFLSSREHYAFALFFLTDRFGMLWLFLIWLTYAVFCAQFIRRLWSQNEYVFVYNSRLWNFGKRWARYGLMALGFLQPLMLYGLYLVVIAKQDGLLARAWPVLLFSLILTLLISGTAEWQVRHPQIFTNRSLKVIKWPFRRPVSWIYWTLEWLVRERGLTLLFCKIGASGVVLGTILYYKSGIYDIRLPAIGLSLGYLLNMGISFEIYRWESEVWLWNRSLPQSVLSRFCRMLALHAIILIPETLIAIRQGGLNFTELIQLFALGWCLLVLFHTNLYKKKALLENLMQPVLLGFVVLTLLILYKVPPLLIASSILAFSIYKFPGWYRG
jgi:hypothetical protein